MCSFMHCPLWAVPGKEGPSHPPGPWTRGLKTRQQPGEGRRAPGGEPERDGLLGRRRARMGRVTGQAHLESPGGQAERSQRGDRHGDRQAPVAHGPGLSIAGACVGCRPLAERRQTEGWSSALPGRESCPCPRPPPSQDDQPARFSDMDTVAQRGNLVSQGQSPQPKQSLRCDTDVHPASRNGWAWCPGTPGALGPGHHEQGPEGEGTVAGTSWGGGADGRPAEGPGGQPPRARD